MRVGSYLSTVVDLSSALSPSHTLALATRDTAARVHLFAECKKVVWISGLALLPLPSPYGEWGR